MVASSAAQPRKRWFRFGLSIRGFLVITTIVSILLATWIKNTRSQLQVCGRLRELGISYAQYDPPRWLQFLPASWLALYDGHWCRGVKIVDVIVGRKLSSAVFDRVNNPIDALTGLPHLQEMRVHNLPFSNDHAALTKTLAPLANVRGLRTLELSVFNGGYQKILAAMPAIPALESLTLSSYDPDLDAGLQDIGKFPNLQTVSLSGAIIDGKDFRLLASLRSLKVLSTPDSPFTAADLAGFANHPSLRQFNNQSQLTDDMLRILSTCPNMEVIDASDTFITDQTLAQLSTLIHLESLDLSGSSIMDDEFRHLANCKSLRRLNCRGCNLTDAIGPVLAQLPLLESIELEGTRTTGRLFTHLQGHHHLAQIDLGQLHIDINEVLSFIDDRQELLAGASAPYEIRNAYYHLGQNNHPELKSHLSSLNLSGIRGLKGRLHTFQKLSTVKDAGLSDTDVDDSDLRAIASVCSLNSLDIADTNISAAGLSALSNQSLMARLCVGPFDDADQAMKNISSLFYLEDLTFYGSERLTESGIQALSQMANLETISFPDRQFDMGLTKSLCDMLSLSKLEWENSETFSEELLELQLILDREKLGIPNGLESWLSSHLTTNKITIVDPREWELLKLHNVQELDASGVSINSTAIEAIKGIPNLRSLNLSNTGLNDDQLKSILSLSTTSPSLGLLSPRARSLGLTSLKPRSPPSTLILDGNPITDDGINAILEHEEFMILGLARTKITDASVARIVAKGGLQGLDVSGTAVTSQAWQERGKYSRTLEAWLAIADTPASIDLLRKVPATLQPENIILYQDSIGVTRDQLMILQGLKPPTELSELDITTPLLQAWPSDDLLRNKTLLRTLNIYETHRVAELMQIAAVQCPDLTNLTLSSEPLDAADSWQLPSRLRSIKFNHCTITDAVLTAMGRCPLYSVEFEHCDLESCHIEKLSDMHRLTELSISRCKQTDTQEQYLKQLCNSLR